MPFETLEINGSKGCGFGWVTREITKDTQRRTTDLENKFWFSLVFSFSTLVGILVNILLTMGKP